MCRYRNALVSIVEFLGLTAQKVGRTNEMSNYYVALSLQHKNLLNPFEYP